MPIQTIESGDFVNQGRDKVNESLGEMPVGFEVIEGDLVVTKHNGDTILVPLKNFFALLDAVFGDLSVGRATIETPGTVLLVDDEDPEQQESSSRVLTAAQVLQLIADKAEPNLQQVVTKGGETVDIVRLLGGIITELPTTTNTNLPMVVIGPNGKLYKIAGNPTTPTNPTTPPTTLNLTNPLHFTEVADVVVPPNPPTGPAGQVRVNSNTCSEINGWGASGSNPNQAATVEILVDGVVIGTAQCTGVSPDVRDYLATIGIVTTNTQFGYNFPKPTTYNDGTAHAWAVRLVGTQTYGFSETGAALTTTCTGLPDPAPNRPPVATNLADVELTKGTANAENYTFPPLFSDPDGDGLTITCTLPNGSLLPAGWSWNSSLNSISFPASNTRQQLALRFTASDGQGHSVSDELLFTVNRPTAPVNRPPVATHIDDVTLTKSDGGANSYTFPALFTDPDGDALTIVCTLPDGSALPAGWSWNASLNSISFPASNTIQQLGLRFTAADIAGNFASDELLITINRPAEKQIVGYDIFDFVFAPEDGESVDVYLLAIYEDGTSSIVTSGNLFALTGQYPNGMYLVPGSFVGSVRVKLPANTISDDVPNLAIKNTLSHNGLVVYRQFTARNKVGSNPPSTTPVAFVPPGANWYSNDFNSNQTDPGFQVEGAAWNYANGKLCQAASPAGGLNTQVYHGTGEDGLNATRIVAKIIASNTNANSYLGIGIRTNQTNTTGYGLLVLDSGRVGLINQGVEFGPSTYYAVAAGTAYFFDIEYIETGSNTATVRAKLWKATDPEPGIWSLVWEFLPRREGYSALLGSSNGDTTACVDEVFIQRTQAVVLPVISKLSIYTPAGWHSGTGETRSENVTLLAKVDNWTPGMVVEAQLPSSRNDSTWGVMQVIDYSNNPAPNVLPAGYTHYTVFNDEQFSG